jgi:hypothetical protein
MTFTAQQARVIPGGAAAQARAVIPWGFPEVFVISQTLLPALLYLPGAQSVRLWLRVAPFLISLAAFGWWLMREHDDREMHPASAWIAGIMGLLAVMVFHPTTASLMGGVAHMAVYFAVLAPVFWAPSMVRSPEHLARLLGLILICSGLNAVVGVLQVYDPGRWMPPELSRVIMERDTGLGPVTYVGPDGRIIVRPPGLFDTPGAVAGPGMFAALLGAVFGLSALPLWQRGAAFALSAAGVAAIYLSQVRVSLVVLVLMAAAYAFVLLRQGRTGKASTFGILAGSVLVGAFTVAVALGGTSISQRVFTLLGDDPLEVYYRARGLQLDYTLSELVYQFPLGAGLGRWGMAAGYFASGPVSTIWAEIQVTGWVIDGGILMVVLYVGALVVSTLQAFRLSAAQHPRVAACAAVVFGANLGIAVMTLSFTPFVTQIGLQYWFLAGALHGIVQRRMSA